jgi:hypothetical protein
MLCIAQGELQPAKPSIRKMKERIRIRLRDAVPLESADYRIALSVALGVDSQKNQRRYALFELSRAVLNVPAVCEEDRERAETELGRRFGLS